MANKDKKEIKLQLAETALILATNLAQSQQKVLNQATDVIEGFLTANSGADYKKAMKKGVKFYKKYCGECREGKKKKKKKNG